MKDKMIIQVLRIREPKNCKEGLAVVVALDVMSGDIVEIPRKMKGCMYCLTAVYFAVLNKRNGFYRFTKLLD